MQRQTVKLWLHSCLAAFAPGVETEMRQEADSVPGPDLCLLLLAPIGLSSPQSVSPTSPRQHESEH
ncbi:hypothetical protein INR49_022750 [Caranx melampygus]|nr:hypothetical protein INR49_022750 [Caranx melampygus]